MYVVDPCYVLAKGKYLFVCVIIPAKRHQELAQVICIESKIIRMILMPIFLGVILLFWWWIGNMSSLL